MTPELILTEEIIECFKDCAKVADYDQFLRIHKDFIAKLVCYLGKTHIEDFNFCQVITQTAQSWCNTLASWVVDDDTCAIMEVIDPEFCGDFIDTMVDKNWDNFYEMYKSQADFIISEARKQNVVDFKIECDSGFYENFEFRDLAVSNGNQSCSFNITYDNIMKNLMDQKMKSLETKMERSMEKKMKEFLNPREEILKKEILSLKSQVEEDKKAQEDMKTNFEHQLQAVESSLQTLIITKISEQHQQFETKLARQKLEFQMKFLHTKLSETKMTDEFEAKLENIKQDLDKTRFELKKELRDQLIVVGSEMKNSLGSKIEDLKNKMESMDGQVEQIHESIQKMMADVERLRKLDNTSGTESDLDHFHISSDSESDLEADREDIVHNTAESTDSNDDSIRKLEKNHRRKLMIQKQVNDEQLRKIREQREEMNRRAEEENNTVLARIGSFRGKK